MPSPIRTAISNTLYYIGSWFRSLSYRFDDAADWAYGIPFVGPSIASPLYRVADYCYYIYGYFTDLRSGWLSLCNWLDAVWDNFGDLWYDLGTLFNYAHDYLRDKIYDALDIADDAWDRALIAYQKARDAWSYATGWLTDRANEAWSRAGNIWGTVTNWLKQQAIDAYNKAVWAYEQIAAAVTAQAQEIYAWVEGIVAEIRAFVDGVVADIGAVTTDIVQALINTALAAIAGPVNLINQWFDDIQNFFNSPLDWLSDKFEDWFFGPEK